MLSRYIASALSVVLVTLPLLPLVAAASNSTLASRSSNSQALTCANVAGNYNGWSYNFGCLCEPDIDDFCNNNNINGYIQSLLEDYVSDHGSNYNYPSHAQPTCDGAGGYGCGSLSKDRNSGQCVTSGGGTSSCSTNQCSSNGACCPRGQTYSNGKCCGNTGCSRSGNTCSPITTCTTSGWTFYDSKCCPSGASQSGNAACSCTDPQTTMNSAGTACISKCTGSQSGWTYYNNKCCPSGASQSGNAACSCTDPQTTMNSAGTACVSKCTGDQSGWKYCNSKCCPSGSTEDSNKVCVCDDASTQLNSAGTACVPKCTSSQTYNTVTKTCDNHCDTGYTYQQGWSGRGLCCKSGATACETICCSSGYTEMGSPSMCCLIGSTVQNGRCVSPTGKSHRRALAGQITVGEKVQLAPAAMYGLAANANNKLCPVGLAACPIPGRPSGEYECLDSLNDLQSCGGCASMGTGQDCTTIPGARWMGCASGTCEVYSCKAGWAKVNGTSCARR